MTVTSPHVPALLEVGTIKSMVHDGELEGGKIHGEEASNVDCVALELLGVVIEKTMLIGAHFSRIAARDVIVVKSDFSGVIMADGDISRAEFDSCRMTGFDVSKTRLRDIVFRGCKLDLANFRFADLRRVRFIDCTFSETDFLHAQLHDVTFESCVLDRTVFDHVRVQKLDLRKSELIDISGWSSLQGATIDSIQLMAVAPYLARELRLTVRDN